MHSEPAATPWNVESAADVASVERPYLWLVPTDDADPLDDGQTVPPVLVMRTPVTRGDDVASPPLAQPVENAASALWTSSADLVGLLAAASEHRRVVDLIWSASQIGALQLPPTLLAAIERARASWPQALPATC